VSALLTSLLAALAPAQTPGAGLARSLSLPVAEGWKACELVLCDVDADGVADLVLGLAGPDGARRIELRLRRATAPSFALAADLVVDLPKDVIAFAVADVHADPGDELVLFGVAAAFVARPRAADAQRFAKLAPIELFWQYADPGRPLAWQDGVHDVDGDGLDDLVVPEPGGYRLLIQRRDAAGVARFESSPRLAAGAEAELLPGGAEADPSKRGGKLRGPRGKREVSFGFGSGGLSIGSRKPGGGTLLRIDERIHAARLHDWEGDGDRDLLCLTRSELLVFRQEPRGSFAAEPALRLTSPVLRDRARDLDLSFEAWSSDLERDGKVDLVFSAGDKRSEDPRTQLLAYQQTLGAERAWDAAAWPLFGEKGAPRQLLVLSGLARPLALDDVDGDGREDLVALSIRADLIDGLRAAASESVEAELYVFRGSAAAFEKRPALVRRVELPARSGDRTLVFAGDVTGDGVAELFARDGSKRLTVWRVRKAKDGALEVAGEPLGHIALPEEARIVLPERLGKGSWDLFAWTSKEVVCASLR